MPGDEIAIIDERVFVNGEPLADEHAFIDPGLETYPESSSMDTLRVPQDEIFLMGDNRRRSSDSRFYGTIPLSDVFGLARVVYWSREWTFTDPDRSDEYELGEIRWARFGMRLDGSHTAP